MQWSLPREGGAETLAGFLLARLGKIPRGGETIEYEGRRFTVLEMNGLRISKVRIEVVPQAVPKATPQHTPQQTMENAS
jgi:CBS domain containing-hemolysin-like protein